MTASMSAHARLVVPPPAVREIVETTASFVANKPALEAKILQRRRDDPKIAFLHPGNPYHAYYASRVAAKRAESARTSPPLTSSPPAVSSSDPVVQSAQPPVQRDAQKDAQRQAAEDRAAAARATQTAAPVVSLLKAARVRRDAAREDRREPPPDDLFSVHRVTLSPHPLALDVIKLAAEFVACHGQPFLAMISAKESRNSLFDFLKPLHPHFIIFQRLVDAYKLLLADSDQRHALVDSIKRQAQSKDVILEDVWYMHDWECQKAEREHEAAMDESQKLKAAQIDWHDFVVLQTIDFDGDADLPAPIADTEQLPRILAAAEKAAAERVANDGDVDMEIDAEPPTAADPRVKVDVVSDIPADRIRSAPVKAPEPAPRAEATIVLPSGQRVPLSQAEPSMRAELINPAYKKERARAAEKNRLQNLAGGAEMARNLARLDASRTESGVYNRADLQSELSGMPRPSPEEVDKKLKTAEPSGPQLPDGHGLAPPAKRARVEAAVDVLSKGRKNVEEVVVEEEAPAEDKLAGMMSAAEWLKKQGNTAQVRIKLPVHQNKEWSLQGQEIEMKAPLKRTVAKLKAVIAKLTKLPANKQKLLIEGTGFLKDKISLAMYNVADGSVISLEVKERGGRKKNN